jgi:hypothetical protein
LRNIVLQAEKVPEVIYVYQTMHLPQRKIPFFDEQIIEKNEFVLI